jgi:hypothetical protein
MIGKTADGWDIQLTSREEELTRLLLNWAQRGTMTILPEMGRQTGKSVIISTVAWYDSQQMSATLGDKE